MRPETLKAVYDYAKEVKKFKKFCKNFEALSLETKKELDEDEIDWYALSLGFFIALKVPVDQAIELALYSRYQMEYWSTEDGI